MKNLNRLLSLSIEQKLRFILIIEISMLKEGTDQESIQLSTTPHPGYQWESDNFTMRHHEGKPGGSALSQQVTTNKSISRHARKHDSKRTEIT